MEIRFKESLTFRDFPEHCTDNELRARILDINLSLSSMSKKLYNFTIDSGASQEFCNEVNNIRNRIRYLYVLSDAATNSDLIPDTTEEELRFARLGFIHACDDFYRQNNKTLATINKYLSK